MALQPAATAESQHQHKQHQQQPGGSGAEGSDHGPLPTLLTARRFRGGAAPEGLLGQHCVPDACGMARNLRIRNTFIDTAEERSPSLERFYREREVHTCPSRHVGRLKASALLQAIEGSDAADCPASPRSLQTCDTEATGSTGCPSLGCPQDADMLAEQAHIAAACPQSEYMSHLPIGMASGPMLPQPAAFSWAVPCPDVLGGRMVPDMVTYTQGSWMPGPLEAASCIDYATMGQTAPMQFVQGVAADGQGIHHQMAAWQLPPQGQCAMACVGATGPEGGLVPAFSCMAPGALPSQHEQQLVSEGTVGPLPPQASAPCAPTAPSSPPETSPQVQLVPVGGHTVPAAAVTAAPELPPPPTEPAPGSPELPSVGSAGHAAGECKPCAFFHSGRCGNGVLCQFCHLCDAGERKRRRKEKLELRRSAPREAVHAA